MTAVRIVVVGAGVIGLLTAVECVLAGAQVDLVEQSCIPCAAAASYDRHRVVRTLHRGDPALTLAAARLPAKWLEVERRLSGRFYHRTGVLTALPAAQVPGAIAQLAAAGVPARALPADQLAARYPQFRFGAGIEAVLEPDAGTVQADEALLAAARWLREQPEARLHPYRRVLSLEASGAVRLADGSVLFGDRVVVAAGPWSQTLLPAPIGSALTLKRQTMLSYQPTAYRAAWSGSPAVLGLGGADSDAGRRSGDGAETRDAWVMPPVAGTPVRMSAASACRTVPELADRDTPAEWRDHLIERFSRVLTGFDPAAVVGATEGYYLTDESGDGPLLVDLGDGAVWVYGACGGMSFKFAPPVAAALADRALGRRPGHTGLDRVDRPVRSLASDRSGTG